MQKHTKFIIIAIFRILTMQKLKNFNLEFLDFCNEKILSIYRVLKSTQNSIIFSYLKFLKTKVLIFWCFLHITQLTILFLHANTKFTLLSIFIYYSKLKHLKLRGFYIVKILKTAYFGRSDQKLVTSISTFRQGIFATVKKYFPQGLFATFPSGCGESS